jgi:hypothetical protein
LNPTLRNLLTDGLTVLHNGMPLNKTLCEVQQHRIYNCILLHWASCVMHKFCTNRMLSLFLTSSNRHFSPVYISKVPWRVCLWGPIYTLLELVASLVDAIYQKWIQLGSQFPISRILLPCAEMSCILSICSVFYT